MNSLLTVVISQEFTHSPLRTKTPGLVQGGVLGNVNQTRGKVSLDTFLQVRLFVPFYKRIWCAGTM